jgi:hypothetical protein
MHNPILLSIENNDLFLAFPLVLLDSHKPTKTHYTFNYKLTKDNQEKNSDHQFPNPAISLAITFFSRTTHIPIENPLYISTLML